MKLLLPHSHVFDSNCSRQRGAGKSNRCLPLEFIVFALPFMITKTPRALSRKCPGPSQQRSCSSSCPFFWSCSVPGFFPDLQAFPRDCDTLNTCPFLGFVDVSRCMPSTCRLLPPVSFISGKQVWMDSLSFGLTVQRHSSLHPGHGVSLFCSFTSRTVMVNFSYHLSKI